jgi:hypothetical protein
LKLVDHDLRAGRSALRPATPSREEIALRPVGGIDPEKEPERFLQELAQHLHGTYLFATDLHDEAHCPFHDDVLVRLQSTAQSERSRSAAAA